MPWAHIVNGSLNVSRKRPGSSNSKDTMMFSIPGEQRMFTLEGFLYLSCQDGRQDMPPTVEDLICLFGDLYSRAKTGAAPADGCGCKSLHELVIPPEK